MIRFPTTCEDAVGTGTIRAGGTDLQERRRHGISPRDDLVDLRDVPGSIDDLGDGVRIGATATVRQLAEHPVVRARYPMLAQAASILANPHIRAVATVGGNLLQANRCWYYRDPATTECFHRGGTGCSTRLGDSSHHAVFDRSPCAAVHPSTLGMALLAWETALEVVGPGPETVAALYGDGSDPTVDHLLPPGSVLKAIVVRGAFPAETGGYLRAISRRLAEWPAVEAGARLQVDQGRIRAARVVVGAVARTPLRLTAVEEALVGADLSEAVLQAAAARASDGANPVAMSAWKVPLVAGTVLSALERAAGSEAV